MAEDAATSRTVELCSGEPFDQKCARAAPQAASEALASGRSTAVIMTTAGSTSSQRPGIPKRRNTESAPLSFVQRQMWVIDQMTPGNPAYNMPHAFHLLGPLKLKALEDSFNSIIQRHEILRTTFSMKDGEPTQFIHTQLKIKISVKALDHLNEAERGKTLQAFATAESLRSFDLSRLPLIRVAVFKLGESEHVLVLNLHHIVADGLSVRRLLDELDAFYGALVCGGDRCPAELAVQYADFAEWQQRRLADEAGCARQIAFWREQLGGSLPVFELPGQKPRPARQSFKGSTECIDIPATQVRELKSLGGREGCTFFMTMLATFQVLLHRYAGLEDIVIGTPVAIRTAPELQALIGAFLNMVGLRCDPSGNPTFIELLRRTRNKALSVFSNCDLPLEVLMKHLKFVRDPSRNPVFQVAFQVLPTPAPQIGNLQVSSFAFERGFAQFDLTLHLHEDNGGYRGRFEYCTDLFEAATIRRLGGHYLTLLESIIREPTQSVSTLPMLTSGERHQVVEAWNQTAATYPAARCVHELVAAQARRRPEALAAADHRQQLTYRQLDQRAEALAARLRELGVRTGSLVGVYLERSVELLVGRLAVWKAGGAYVPIDPEYPAERVRFMLEDAQAVAVLTQQTLSGKLPVTDLPWVDVQAAADRGPTGSGSGAESWSPEQLAYVIYTSGSTGRPKGVPIRHASLCNLIYWHQQAYQVSPADRATQIAGPGFDASVWELWPYLTAGASVHIPEEATRLNAARLVHWLAEQGITLSFLPTPLAEAVLREPWPATAALRVLLTGGDRLNQRPARPLPFRLVNHYGPTENTVVSTWAEVDAGPGNTAPPIGRPLPNTQAYIVDRHLQPVPIGVPGELLLGGAQLTPGYWQRPDLSAEKFVADPFGAKAGGRLYRTGDRVRWLPEGQIEFLGRIDEQIKLRGFRIEPGEIEAVLRQHPAVEEVLVLAREDGAGEKRLVAYVAAEPPSGDLAGELRARLRAVLPEYMVPTAIVLLAAFPLTPNGKIDRQQLPPPERSDGDPVAYVAPRSPTEENVMSLFRSVLERADFGVCDSFFDLGGHSLMAARLMFKLRTMSGLDLPLRQLFERPTVAALAEAIDALAWSVEARVPARVAGEREEVEW
jgi:amino acid adenylation domain-containing protein